jgi:N-acetylglutamate synthase
MTEAPYQLRPMKLADFKEVTALWRITEGVGLDKSDSRPAIRSYLARNRGLSFVIRHQKKIIGAVLCGHDGRRGFLYHLAVAKAHRNQGLGKKLVEACLAKLQRLGIHKCNIYLFRDNTGGEQFWTRAGWAKRPDVQLLQKALVRSPLRRCC